MLVCPFCRLVLGDDETTCPRDGQAGTEARTAQLPESLAQRFTIVSPYAQGGTGDLFLADDTQTGQRGILKVLRLPKKVTPAERSRLKRELAKQATLSPSVLAVPFATGEVDGTPWLFREWHEGVSLRLRVQRSGPLELPEALAIAAQIGLAMDELHRSGLLHRDLKSAHVILMPRPSGLPRVAVIDAGMASRIDLGTVFDISGTPEYLSPEQAKGKLVSFRSDLYALGCVLFEMLTGAPPFVGDPVELLDAHANQPAPTPSVSIPTGVATLLAQLLAKEPRERPFSAQQVRRALEPFLPEESGAQRESTQTYEKEDGPHRPPSGGIGTLRPQQPRQVTSTSRTMLGMPAQTLAAGVTPKSVPPPPPSAALRKGASVPPPPPKTAKHGADSTEELSPVDLAQAEEILPPTGLIPGVSGAPPRPDGTEELVGADLESADFSSGEKKSLSGTLLGMQAQRAPSGPTPFTVPAAPAPAVAPSASVPANAPPWEAPVAAPIAGELDYEDLAETTAFDGEGGHAAALLGGIGQPTASSVGELGPTDLPEADGATDAFPVSGAPFEVVSGSTPPPSEAQRIPGAWSATPFLIAAALIAFCFFGSAVLGIGLWFGTDEGADAVASAAQPSTQPVETTPPPMPLPTPVHVPQPVEPPIAAFVEPVEPVQQPEPVALVEAPVPAPAEPPPQEGPAERPAPAPRETPAQPRETRTERPPRETQTERPPRERPVTASSVGSAPPAEAASGNRVQRFNQLREEALAHFRAQRFPQAARAYEQASELNPRHAGSFAGLGAARLAQGQHARAITAYRRAIQLQPRTAGFHAALGHAYQAAGDRAQARQAFQRALELDGDNQAARRGLAALGG